MFQLKTAVAMMFALQDNIQIHLYVSVKDVL